MIDPATQGSPGSVVDVDNSEGFVDLKRGNRNAAPHPAALIAKDIVGADAMRDSLLRFADAVIQHGLTSANPFAAGVDLLMRSHPRTGQQPGAPIVPADEDLLAGSLRAARSLDRSVLPIQGPPGAGKTYTGGRIIAQALADGKKVGVTALSHKVIANLLDSACEAARGMGISFSGIQKASEDQKCGSSEVVATSSNEAVLEALESGAAQIAAGTAWLWSREDMAASVDLLVIDEAGQFPLANALAVAPAASSLILLGDPRQLEQPLQGSHPPGAAASALDHLLGDHLTVPPDRGLFLPRTWRLNPEICRFSSEVFYDGRLSSRPGLEVQTIRPDGELGGAGLRLVNVEHSGNQSESVEEAKVVGKLVTDFLDGGKTWINDAGAEHLLRLADILVVTPYNAQVALLAEHLPPGARIGTVDKFQGQEAPISIYSIATSTPADAPRGMEFLYNPNRLNVATSRAKCLTVLVANAEIFTPEARTPRQMQLANGFCRFREMADGVHR